MKSQAESRTPSLMVVGDRPPAPGCHVGAAIESQVDESSTIIVDGTGTRFVLNIEELPPAISLEDVNVAFPFDVSFGCLPESYLGFAHD